MSTEIPTYDLAECARFISFWSKVTGAPHITLTAITPDGPTATATFTPAQLDQAGGWIACAQSAGRNVYFEVNETPIRCTAKPQKRMMTAALCRHADVDPMDDLYPYAEERDRLHRLAECLRGDQVMPPTTILDSGNGIQPLWAIVREPLTPEIIERVECENRAIEAAVGAAGTHNIDRLLRLPGTLNYPNAKKLKLGRGVTRACTLYHVDATYTVAGAAGLGAHLQKLLSGSGLVRSPLEDAEPRTKPAKATGQRVGADRSRIAMRKGAAMRHAGNSYEEMCAALRADPETADWYEEKGEHNNERELHRIYDRATPPPFGALPVVPGLSSGDPAPAPVPVGKQEVAAEPPGQGETGGKLPQRQRLIETALAVGMRFWRDLDANAYATVQHNHRTERHKVQSAKFRLLLRSLYADRWPERANGGLIPGSVSDTAMAEALPALEAMALKGEVREPDVRVTRWQGAFWLDLGDVDWRSIKITADGWEIVDAADVPLIRPAGMRPLLVPRRDPDALGRFERLLNLDTKDDPGKDDLKLVTAWLVAALHPNGPYPIMAIDGEQGAAKTTACRVLRRLVDPNKADLRAPPKTEDDLVIAATGGRVVGIDNLSRMPEELMDAVCRLATGTGIGKRKLYTDGEEVIFSAARPVLLNGIPSMLARGDLADRAISITLPEIPKDRRLAEEALWSDFDAAAPGILALLLDGVATALRRLPTLYLKELPRMADFARLACAAAPAFGWTEDDMLETIKANRGAAADAVIDAEPLVDPIRAIAATAAGTTAGAWRGTATALLNEINRRASPEQQRKPGWPRDGARLSGRIARIAPALRSIGICVEKVREGHERGRLIVIRPSPEIGKTPSASSASSASEQNQGLTADDAADNAAGASVRSNPLKTKAEDGADGADGVSTAVRGGRQTRRNRAPDNGAFGAFAAPAV